MNPVLVNVLCGRERDGWLNPQLVIRLLEAIADANQCGRALGVDLTIGVSPVERARNQIVTRFLKSDVTKSSHDWLVMIDCDVVPPAHFLRLIDAADQEAKFIVAAPCPMINEGGRVTWNVAHKIDERHSNFYQTLPAGWTAADHLGTGFLAVRRCVFESMKSGWFDRVPSMGEDFAFSERVRAAGFTPWFHGAF